MYPVVCCLLVQLKCCYPLEILSTIIDNSTTTEQSTMKPNLYFMGHATVGHDKHFIINPLQAKFSEDIILHFMSFIHIDMTQVLKILPKVREGPTYFI